MRVLILILGMVISCATPPVAQRADLRPTLAESVPVLEQPQQPQLNVEPHHTKRVVRVAVISDLNSSYGSTEYSPEVQAAIAWLIHESPDIVISTGDLVAGMKAGLDYPAMWTAFHQVVSQPLQDANIPFAPSPGNHDAAPYAAYETERNEYLRQWKPRLPDLDWVSQEHWPRQYAFRVINTVFVSLDLAGPKPLTDADYQWLKSILEDHPSAVVYGHVPIVPIAHAKAREASGDMRLQDLLAEHRAMFLHGHHHAYFRHFTGNVLTISVPCLGTGPRRLQGQSAVSPRGIVMLEVSEDGVRDTMIEVPGFQLWPAHLLPSELNWPNTTLKRALPDGCGEAEVC